MKAKGKKQKRKRGSLPRGRAWLAVGTIAAYTAAGATCKGAVAFAQKTRSQPSSQAQLPVWRFDIPAGPLDAALDRFGAICGLRIEYSIPAETIPGFTSPGVSGLHTQREALSKILAGTGLSFQFSGASLVLIRVAIAESVEVTGSAASSVAMNRFPSPLLDTPQSITAIPGQVLSDQAVSTLRDTLRDAPGISLAAGEGGAQGDNLTIRGFTAQDDIFLDGMRDIGDYYRDPFDDGQVDVLEGPAGAEFGRGSTGGVINRESKAPLNHALRETEGTLGSDRTRRFNADINQPLSLPGGAAFRMNLMVHDAGIAEREVVANRRWGAAPTIALGMNTGTRLTASYLHFAEDDIPDYGLPWYFGKPAPVARQNYYGLADHNFLRADVDIGTVKLEHDFGSHGLFSNAVRYGNYRRKWQITEPQVNNSSAGIITPQTPLDEVMVNRNQLAGHSIESSFWDQAGITLTGKLLGVRQTAVLGAEGGKETSDPVRLNFNNASGLNTVPLTPLLVPHPHQPFSGTANPRSVTHTTAHSFSVYLLDTFELGKGWELNGGFRWDRFDAAHNAVDYAFNSSGALIGTPAQFIQPLDKPTWRGALVYKPKPNASVYFAAGSSFDPSAETLSLTAATAATPPEENESFEAGGKLNLNGGRLSLRGALFRTEKQNAREPDPNDSSIDVLAGNQRVDGAEAALQGHIADRWEMLSSYTFMHSEVVNSKAYPYAVGRSLNNVPENLFNLWTEYRLRRGWQIGGGANYVGARTANTATLTPTTILESAPGYLTFNAMTKYAFNDRLTVQANAANLTNRFFMDELHSGHAIPGAGASALLGIKLNF